MEHKNKHKTDTEKIIEQQQLTKVWLKVAMERQNETESIPFKTGAPHHIQLNFKIKHYKDTKSL